MPASVYESRKCKVLLRFGALPLRIARSEAIGVVSDSGVSRQRTVYPDIAPLCIIWGGVFLDYLQSKMVSAVQSYFLVLDGTMYRAAGADCPCVRAYPQAPRWTTRRLAPT